MTQCAEPNLYDYWPYEDRPKIVWPEGKKLAFWIAPNIEYYEFQPPHNDKRQPWPRGNPDITGFSAPSPERDDDGDEHGDDGLGERVHAGVDVDATAR